MKTILKSVAAALIIAATMWSVNSCRKADDGSSSDQDKTSGVSATSVNSLEFPSNAHMGGKSLSDWTVAYWRWAYSFDCAHSPFFDTTGAFANQNQSGPVFFLAAAAVNVPNITRNLTIGHEKYILALPLGVLNDFPCPDTSFHPAPGQSLSDFLTIGSQQYLNYFISTNGLPYMTLDGVTLTSNYLITPLFNFTGNTDLANCFDGCVNGLTQQAVDVGYWMMLKPLSPGTHVLILHGAPSITYNITVN